MCRLLPTLADVGSTPPWFAAGLVLREEPDEDDEDEEEDNDEDKDDDDDGSSDGYSE
jgi:hypothetical protein